MRVSTLRRPQESIGLAALGAVPTASASWVPASTVDLSSGGDPVGQSSSLVPTDGQRRLRRGQ